MDSSALGVIVGVVAFTLLALAAAKVLSPREPRRPITEPGPRLPESIGATLAQLRFEWHDGTAILRDGPVTIRASSTLPLQLIAQGGLPERLILLPANGKDATDLREHAEPTPTGDRVFDGELCLWADPIWMCAILDTGTRNTLRNRFARADLRVLHGSVIWTSATVEPSAEEIPEAVRLLGELTRLLSAGPDEDAAAAANLAAEPDPRVRQQMVRALATRRHSSAAAGALERACRDRDLEVQMLAATLHPCEAGKEALHAIARNRIIDEPFRRTALHAFAAHASEPETAKLAASIVATETPELARDALFHAGGELVNQDAVRALSTSSRAEIRLAAVPHIDGATRDGESALVARLEDGDARVALAAIARLRDTGALSAVAPLGEIANALLGGSDAKTAARAAIDAIQQRANGAAGSVSLVEGDDAKGRLSNAAQAGTLTTPEGKRRG